MQGQLTPQQVLTQGMMSALTVSVFAQAVGMMVAALETYPEALGAPVPSKAIDDLRLAYGTEVVNKAIKEKGTDDILVLAAAVEKFYLASMRKKYGEWATNTALETAPPGDVRAANEIARVLATRGVTPASPVVKVEEAVETGRAAAARKAQPVKDTKTGKVYPSKSKAGMAVAAEYGLDPTETFIWYEVIKKDPKRFVRA